MKPGPRPARAFTIRGDESGKNYAYESGTGLVVEIRDMKKTELIRACARYGLKIPAPHTRWLEVPNHTMVALLHGLETVRSPRPKATPETTPSTPSVVVSQETEKETTVTTPTPSTPSTSGDIGPALDVLRKLLGNGIDTNELESMVERAVTKLVARPVVVQLGETRTVEFKDRLVHQCFPELLRKVQAGVHIMLTGGPGVGKTTVCEHVAEALALQFLVVTMKPLPQDHELLGFVSPVTGQVVTGDVRELYENGGLLVLDELDTAHPGTPPTLNMLLAQDYFDFPRNGGGKERVRKHKDFRVIATGNTYGGGGSLEFSGTTRMNTATLDRFTFFHVPIDEKLEEEVCRSIDPTFGPMVVATVRKARANVQASGLKVFVTPRASIDATKMMVAGDSLRQALNGRLFGRGLPMDQEAKLLEGITFG